jgi:murein DD-endopeptidase MepM/ murein hydrolase activator NlpD
MVYLFTMHGFLEFEPTGANTFHITINGQAVGCVSEEARAQELLIEARRTVASASDELVFMEVNMEITGEEVIWGTVDDEATVQKNMEKVLESSVVETMQSSYTLKVNEYMVNLGTKEEVISLLQAAVDKFDYESKYQVEFQHHEEREFNALTVQIADKSVPEEETIVGYTSAGVSQFLGALGTEFDADDEMDFADYINGIINMNFSEEIEIVESYLPESQLTDLDTAIDELIKEQERIDYYTVVSGDTLSGIAIKVDIPMDQIIAMNPGLTEKTILKIGQQLVITIPESTLSVSRVEQKYIEEIYDAEVQVIDVDSWYTTQTEVLQEPSAGFRKIVANITYINNEEVSRDILKEEVVVDAVPMIMRRGTKVPPTFIYPVKGGRLTSGFGKRKAPTAGASTYHKGQDWAVPRNTPVYASSGGKVIKAGWGSGYGYCVYIDHGNGMVTRYAHLNKVLVKAGQRVSQGERIGLSGNTGISSGPHLHFEILVNGKQVDPKLYLK